jgi:hypothetical protein
MYCPICDQKPMNCDCTEAERRMYGENEELQEQVPQWISVSKRLPDVQVNVLLSRPPEHRQSRLRIMRLIDQGYEQYWADDIGDTSPINSYSHWMPLPEPPEVE